MSEHDETNEHSTLNERPVSGWRIAWDWQRILSLVVAIIYLVIGFWIFPPKSVTDLTATILLRIIGLTFPLACIWFGDEMGEYGGSFFRPITKASPGGLVRAGGWLLLLLPVLTGLMIWWIGYGLS